MPATPLILRSITHIAEWTERGLFEGAFVRSRLADVLLSALAIRGTVETAHAALPFVHLPDR